MERTSNPFLPMGRAQKVDEISLELVAEVVDILSRILADDLHLPNVRFGLYVALESVGISTLLGADLAPPLFELLALLSTITRT